MIRFISTSAALLAMSCSALGNNIQILSSELLIDDPEPGSAVINVQVQWENSWRTSSAPNNWDAAWIFVKYQDDITGLWHHARLHGDGEHIATGGMIVSTGLLTPGQPFHLTNNWGVGVFVHRGTDGFGTVNESVGLRWNYALQGVDAADIAQMKAFAIEMVYVPEGAFYLGSGGTEASGFTDGAWTAGASIPLQIGSESALTVAETPGNLWSVYQFFPEIVSGLLPAAFPKGYSASYMMKYGIAQQDYVDFLNTLNRTQQNNRTATGLGIGVSSVANRYVMSNNAAALARNGIRCDATVDANAPIRFYCDLNGNGVGGEVEDGQWIACNYLNWGDVATYLDWSGLRPMTELEFEKACRGPSAPVPNEFAWGTTSFTPATGLTSAGAINESTGTPGSNVIADGQLSVNGPARVGIFATSASTREESGAGYYGNLDLSGNLFERVIHLYYSQAYSYSGNTGDGSLSESGFYDVPAWPAPDAQGTSVRGGSWDGTPEYAVASIRGGSFQIGGVRGPSNGGRGVRQAP